MPGFFICNKLTGSFLYLKKGRYAQKVFKLRHLHQENALMALLQQLQDSKAIAGY